jgi:hypothetical protein
MPKRIFSHSYYSSLSPLSILQREEEKYALSLYIQKHISFSLQVMYLCTSATKFVPRRLPRSLIDSMVIQVRERPVFFLHIFLSFSISPYGVSTYLYGVSTLADTLFTSQPLLDLGWVFKLSISLYTARASGVFRY